MDPAQRDRVQDHALAAARAGSAAEAIHEVTQALALCEQAGDYRYVESALMGAVIFGRLHQSA